MKEKVVPVVFSTDDKYAPYCGVAITSLIANASKENVYKLFIFYDQLSMSNQLRIKQLATENVFIQFINIHDYVSETKILTHVHLTVATVYRLIIPYVLPEYDKVIYLDSDIVINSDVAQLYDFELGENILGAAKGFVEDTEFMQKHLTKTLGIDVNNFFNAGVLIINCNKYKAEEIKAKCFKLLSERTDLIFMDQCALNITCEGKVSWIPKEWNFEWSVLDENDISEADIGEVPAVIHYAGTWKPWDYPHRFMAEYFWKYAKQTLYYEEILQKMQMKSIADVCEIFGIYGQFRNIAVYGAGGAGKRYVRKIMALGICDIVIWVDRNYKNVVNTELPVKSVEELYGVEFDHVVIAIENKEVSNEIKEMLITNGIKKEKIIQVY